MSEFVLRNSIKVFLLENISLYYHQRWCYKHTLSEPYVKLKLSCNNNYLNNSWATLCHVVFAVIEILISKHSELDKTIKVFILFEMVLNEAKP